MPAELSWLLGGRVRCQALAAEAMAGVEDGALDVLPGVAILGILQPFLKPLDAIFLLASPKCVLEIIVLCHVTGPFPDEVINAADCSYRLAHAPFAGHLLVAVRCWRAAADRPRLVVLADPLSASGA